MWLQYGQGWTASAACSEEAGSLRLWSSRVERSLRSSGARSGASALVPRPGRSLLCKAYGCSFGRLVRLSGQRCWADPSAHV